MDDLCCLFFSFPLSRLPMDCLFNETLDLSQDDIQRTLSANLSHETAFHCSGGGGSGSNDGGASCSDGGLGRSIRSVETTAEDDLLVNLDAFDMLTEFSDLDCHDTIDSLISIQADGAGGGGGTSGSPSDGSDGKDLNGIHARIHQLKDMPSPSTLSATGDPLLTSITDFSPEWAPTEVRYVPTGFTLLQSFQTRLIHFLFFFRIRAVPNSSLQDRFVHQRSVAPTAFCLMELQSQLFGSSWEFCDASALVSGIDSFSFAVIQHLMNLSDPIQLTVLEEYNYRSSVKDCPSPSRPFLNTGKCQPRPILAKKDRQLPSGRIPCCRCWWAGWSR
jgi:hypothetical protein